MVVMYFLLLLLFCDSEYLNFSLGRRSSSQHARCPPAAAAWLSFDAYKASCGRPQRRALRELFGHQLLQVPGCGPAKAAAVVREFGTPWRLLAALEPRDDRDATAPAAAPPALVSAVGAAIGRRLCAVFGPDFARDSREGGAECAV